MHATGTTPSSSPAGSSAGDARLRIAVPKGALFEEAVELLVRAGVDAATLDSAGRQLVVDAEDARFVIGRPTDIPTYVERGVADVGIVGKDVLLEASSDVVELLDLGFGGCRFVVAEPRATQGEALERYGHVGIVRVATKYPRVTEAHFAGKGMQVEVVKLHGNIELAPLLGLAELIVDIVSTGRTLAENDLVVVEDVAVSTARLVANPASMRTVPGQVEELAARISGAMGKETP
jgi:ATP phosphoribosyltransferase regulatory subunit